MTEMAQHIEMHSEQTNYCLAEEHLSSIASKQIDMNSLCNVDHMSLRRRLLTLLKEPSDVDDVIQDAYVRLMEIRDKETKIENPRAFLYRVCMNLAVDHLRHRQRTDRLFISADNEWVEEVFEGQIAAPSTPEEECLCENFKEKIISSIEDLPEKCQQAFVLNKFGEFNYKEIASDMGLSVSMIEKYLKRACDRVRDRFPTVSQLNG